MSAPDISTTLGLRDRTMLEVLYACGLRVSELVNLELHQVNLETGCYQNSRQGWKRALGAFGAGSTRLLAAVSIRSSEKGRAQLLGGVTIAVVFPSERKQRMARQTFWHRIKRYALAGRN